MALARIDNDDRPLMEMNTTPLIDVMLVLLIMFIMTIPAATNSVDVDLPGSEPPLQLDWNRPVLLIVTDDDKILWNGVVLNRDQLAVALKQIERMSPEPELRFKPEGGASYDLSAQVLAAIRRSGVTTFGFVGNERFSEFGRAN